MLQNFVGDAMDRNYDPINIISKNLFLRRPRVANFADIIKIEPCLLKQHLTTQKKLKELEIKY